MLIRLFALALRRQKMRFLYASLGVALAAGLATFLLGVGVAVNDVLVAKLLDELPAGQLLVKPKRSSFLALSFKTPKFLGGKSLNAASLEIIRDLDGVAYAFPQLEFSKPISLYGEFFGRSFRSDAALSGIEPAQLQAMGEDIPAFADTGTDYIPLLVSRRLLEMYNESFAGAHGLPGVTQGIAIGLEIELIFGYSSFAGARGERRTRKGKIVGFTDQASALGLSAPLSIVSQYEKMYGGELEFRHILVQAAHAQDLSRLENVLANMGFSVETTKGEAETVAAAITAFALLLFGIGGAVFCVAALNLSSNFAMILATRRKEIGMLRALGCTRRNLLAEISLEALAVSLSGSVLGLGLGYLALSLLSNKLLAIVGPLLKLGSLSLLPDVSWLAMLFSGVLSLSILTVLFSALRFMGRSPSELLD